MNRPETDIVGESLLRRPGLGETPHWSSLASNGSSHCPMVVALTNCESDMSARFVGCEFRTDGRSNFNAVRCPTVACAIPSNDVIQDDPIAEPPSRRTVQLPYDPSSRIGAKRPGPHAAAIPDWPRSRWQPLLRVAA